MWHAPVSWSTVFLYNTGSNTGLMLIWRAGARFKSPGQFTSLGCTGQCVDCFFGGTGNAGLYTCDSTSNQNWVPTGKTFSEDYSGKKCMSQAPKK